MHRLSVAVIIALACSQFVIALPAPREAAPVGNAQKTVSTSILAPSAKNLTTNLITNTAKNGTSHEGPIKNSSKGPALGKGSNLSVSYLSFH